LIFDAVMILIASSYGFILAYGFSLPLIPCFVSLNAPALSIVSADAGYSHATRLAIDRPLCYENAEHDKFKSAGVTVTA